MLGLCMIVKNESAVIERSLRSALPYMDTFCIVDTGSSDDTIAIINRVALELNVPGKVFERPWINFGTNRTECLRLAGEKCQIQWMFMMDADDSLEVDPLTIKSSADILTHLNDTDTGYYIQIDFRSIYINRVHLFNSQFNWIYKGALHEYPHCTNNSRKANLILEGKIKIMARTEGARSADPEKYKKDVQLLLDELTRFHANPATSDVDQARTLFYLAQSYRDSGEKEKAIQYYKERIEVKGWPEEIYIAYCNLIDLTPDVVDKIKYCWKAQAVIPRRRDAVYRVLLHCRKNDIFTQEIFALGMAYRHISLSATNLRLFPDKNAYSWSFDDELSVIAYHTFHYDICREICDELVLKCPESVKVRVQKNLKFATEKM
jgi:glycosyltransferase involved in cell wall biosynthesis